MIQSPFLNDNDADTLPPKVIPQRSVSVQPIKIDCDCSRGRGNFDEGNENDYDKLPKNFEKKPNFNRNYQSKEHSPLIKSNSMDIKNQFRYTPAASDEPSQPEQPPQDIIPSAPPTPSTPKASSPKSSFQKSNNKQPNQNNVSFGGKVVDDHKSGQNRKRGQNQDRGGSNYNRNNDNSNNRGSNRNRSRGISHSSSLSFTLGTKRQQDQPAKQSQPPPQVPLPPPKIPISQSNSSLQSPTVTDWKPNLK